MSMTPSRVQVAAFSGAVGLHRRDVDDLLRSSSRGQDYSSTHYHCDLMSDSEMPFAGGTVAALDTTARFLPLKRGGGEVPASTDYK